MFSNELKMMIDKYFDGELSKNMETRIFTELSNDEEGREYFKQMNKIKSAIQESAEEFPLDLDQKILMKIRSSNEKKPFLQRSLIPVVSYSFAVVLLIVSLFLYFEVRDYRTELRDTSRQMIEQQKTINLLINSLPSVEVETEIQNAVVIKANL